MRKPMIVKASIEYYCQCGSHNGIYYKECDKLIVGCSECGKLLNIKITMRRPKYEPK